MVFDVMEETLKKTTISTWKHGQLLNIESSLRVGDEVGGHFVYGHVDGVAVVTRREQLGGSLLLFVQLPKDLRHHVVTHGSIALDGVSLTIARIQRRGEIVVSLVPYTIDHTTLAFLDVGEEVNIEIDMLLKIKKHLVDCFSCAEEDKAYS